MKKLFGLAAAVLAIGVGTCPIMGKSDKKQPKEIETYAFKRAIEAYGEEDYTTADSWLDQELESNPKNGYAYFYKAVMNTDSNHPGAALTYYDKALKLIPKKQKDWVAAAYNNRSKVHLSLADTVSAYKDITEAIRISPDFRDYYQYRGDLYFDQNRFDEADADYRQMLRLDPTDGYALLAMGRNARERGNLEEAEKLFSQVIKLHPEYPLAYRMHSTIMDMQKRWNELADDIIKAIEYFDEAALAYIDIYPAEGAPVFKAKLKIQAAKDPRNIVWPIISGVLADSQGDYLEAVEFYKKADEIDPNFGIDERISESYMKNGNYDEALRHINKAINMDPTDSSLLDARGDVLECMGRFSEALEDRDKVVEAYPDNEYAYQGRATTYMKMGNYDKAIEDFEVISVIAGDISKSTYYLLNFGDAYRLNGNDEKAREYYNKVVETALKDSEANFELPVAYASLGEADKAIAAMEKVMESGNAKNGNDRYQEACMFVRLGRNADAIASLRKAVKAGYKNGGHILTDFDMAPIRETPEFKAMMEECFPDLSFEPVKNEIIVVEEVKDQTGRGVVVTGASEVPFTREQGVTKVKCDINGLPLYFVFDTGAADVTISQVEATFMLKNDYIKPSDVIGSSYYADANGDVSEGTIINLKRVNFGGLELDNVRASVVRNQKAPLLLGQSVLGRLGRIEIDNPRQKIIISKNF